ncbi:hypothetical protein FB45DRAFT_919492 [Roridomyces roridus]|uniref:F-box domain-containing protein n=1 Tax=Roridomyces roridus TaxID=1738132 RepID=A0AAD7BS31_9AGAR|nr:hypothetical protein FB45DRAFT_919492 [Roridomyces roridus]
MDRPKKRPSPSPAATPPSSPSVASSSRSWTPSPRPLSPLLALPSELLSLIALYVSTTPPNLGPPAVLPLLSTCRTLYTQLTWRPVLGGGNTGLWRSISRAKFTSAEPLPLALSVYPSLSPPDIDHDQVPVPPELALLRANLLALRVLRAGDVYAPAASWALRIAYAMLLLDGGPGAPIPSADPADIQRVRESIGLSPGTPSLAGLGLCSVTVGDQPRWNGGGKNRRQLAWAGASTFAQRFVKERMYEGRFGEERATNRATPAPADGEAEDEDDPWTKGWPLDTEDRAAALWVLWFFEDGLTLRAESEDARRALQTILLPYIVAPFRYPSALCPPHHYTVPLLSSVLGSGAEAGAITIPTNHGLYPIYPLGTPRRSTSRSRSRTRGRLLTAAPARLLYFARLQVNGRMGVPPHLPRDRAEADARWQAAVAGGALGSQPISPTQADVHERNARPAVRFESQVPAGEGVDFWADGDDTSEIKDAGRWGAHVWRGRLCSGCDGAEDEREQRGGAPPGRISRVYELGSFAGLWCGTMLLPSEQPYNAIIAQDEGRFPQGGLARDDFVAAARPMYMRILEHHSFHPETPVPPPSADDTTGDEGLSEGWLPAGAHIVSLGNQRVEVRGAGVGQGKSVYETLVDARVRDGAHQLETCPGCVVQRERERGERARWVVEGANISPLKVHWPEWDAPAWADHRFDQGWEAACDGVQDVVFSGETDPVHGAAWHHFEYSGRVRPWDGLIGLIMRPRNRMIGLATYFISGHLVGRDTFEGTWQMAAQDVLAPSWGGSVCFSRGEE